MKRCFLPPLFFCCLWFSAYAEDVEMNGKTPESLSGLHELRRELAKQMHEQRVELLKSDKAIKELHEKVMALHRELAVRIDNHRDMRDLVKKMREVEIAIKRIEQKQKQNLE